MQKFNAHMHYIKPEEVFEYKNRRLTHEDMVRQLDGNNVVGALVMYCPPKILAPKEFEKIDIFSENIGLVEALDADKGRTYIPFAIMNPKMEDAEEKLETLVDDHGFKGLKLIGVFDGIAYDKLRWVRERWPHRKFVYEDLIRKAGELEIPTMIHSGWEEYAGIEHIEPLISEFPEQTFIIGHMRPNDRGAPRAHVELLKNHDNVYLETSYIDHTDRVRQICEAGLVGRVLWGDDFPWGGGNILHNSRVIGDAVLEGQIGENEAELVFYKNAAELFSIRQM